MLEPIIRSRTRLIWFTIFIAIAISIFLSVTAGSSAAVFLLGEYENKFGVLQPPQRIVLPKKPERTCTPPPPDMVAWWPGDGNPGDIIGPNNGTWIGSQTYGAGEVGQAFSFNGSNYVEAPDDPSLRPESVTVDAWVYPTDTSGYHNAVFKGDHEYLMQIRNGNVLFGSRSGTGSYAEFQGSLIVPVNTWSHVAVTHDGVTKRIYVNGVLDPITQNQEGHYTTNTGTLKIGAHNSLNEPFNGLIDEVEIFGRALSQEEIQRIYDAGAFGKCRTVCAPPPSGMISWWPGNGNPADIIGGNNGSLQGDATFAPGFVGRAFSFDGTGDWVDAGTNPIFDFGTQDFTVDFWVNFNNAGGEQTLIEKLVGQGGPGWSFTKRENNLLFVGPGCTGGWSDCVDSGSILFVANTWYHIAVTRNGAVFRIYLNGSQVASKSDPGGNFSTPGNPLLIGRRNPGDGRGFFVNGRIDEVGIFNRGLSGAEIAAIYDAGASGICQSCTPPPGGMIGWWPGDGNPNDIQNGYDGTLQGNAAFAAGVVDQAFTVDGDGDQVDLYIPNIDTAPNHKVTVDFWMYWNGGEPQMPFGFEFYDLYFNMGYFGFNTANGRIYATSSAGLANRWVHVAAIFNNGDDLQSKLYLDGVEQTLAVITGPATPRTVTQYARIGNWAAAGPNYYFNGRIDELEIFNRELTSSEILAIYNAGNAGKCKNSMWTPQCKGVPSGITAWWRGEGSALDKRKAHHGTLLNGTTFSPGKFGRAFSFDGTDDYVSAPAFDMGTDWTVEGWIYPAACSDGSHCPLFVRSAANFEGLHIQYLGANHFWNNEFVFHIGDGGTWQIALHSATKYEFGSWYHVAATKNGDTYTLYVNGVPKAQQMAAGVSNLYQTREVWLGKWNYGVNAFLQGKIDEVAVYRRALTETEVFAIYRAGNFGKCAAGQTAADFDADMMTDVSIFRPGPGEWWYYRSSDGGNSAAQFGSSSDTIVPEDYTGDGKTDIAFFRPSTGQWFILRSEDSSYYAFPFGTSGDVPAPADYDGDGKADPTVFRASTASWYISRSTGGTTIALFGATGDRPVPEDYDGDGKADIGIFRPVGVGGAEWWIANSSGGVFATQFGQATDKALPADYTGDGKADIAFFSPSTNYWYVLRSDDFSYYAFPFGTSGDLPAPGDYDGDGRADAGIFRPQNATWFVNRSTAGNLILQFGATDDFPVPCAYVR